MSRLFVCCLLFIGFSSILHAQSSQLSGRVLLQGVPVPNAMVHVDSTFYTTTDQHGVFTFQAIPYGQYVLYVRHTGLQLFSKRLQLCKAIHYEQDITLAWQLTTLHGIAVHESVSTKKVQESAMNLTIVQSDFIRKNLGGSLMQSLDKLPGVKSIGIGAGNSKPLIRGLGFNQVMVVENGVKHEGQQWGADHGLEIDQFAAGQVEIIKGPASFMYGPDAIGGAIDIKPISLPLAHTMGGTIDLAGKSNNGQWAASGYFYVRTNRWFLTGRFSLSEYGDFRVPADTVHVYSYAVPLYKQHVRNTAGKERNIHLSTGWLGKKLASIFYISRVYNKSGFFANAHGLEPRRVNHNLHDRSSRDIQMPAQEVTHHKIINKTTFNLQQHHIEWQNGFQHNFREEFNHYVNHGYMPPVYPTNRATPATLERSYKKSVFTTALKDEWKVGQHQFTIGANAEWQHNQIDGWSFLIPAFTQWQGGLYVYDKWRVNNQVILHGALRYDLGRIKIEEYADWFPSAIIENGDTSQQYLVRSTAISRRFASLNWSVGISYEPGRVFMKANLGSSFRMPIAKELGANGVNYHYFRYEKGDATLSPERSYQADISLGWKDEKMHITVSPFFNYFPNYIYLNPTSAHDYRYGAGNQVFYYAQSEVVRYGAEMQAQYSFSQQFEATLAAEYLYNEQLSGAKKGYTIPFTPPPSALLSLQYNIPFKQGMKDTYVGVEYRAVAAQNRVVPPERKTPSYQLFGFNAGTAIRCQEQTINIHLQIKNLFNTRYLDHTSFYRLIELPEMGRNIVLSLQVPFTWRKRSEEAKGS
ncbi:iron complex outermembrane receptor protein [Chitinophaga skermanii]|uniref:Iron complex outermembrane receptor protein n=1 Tax=Chitinophaga skermanii TaxID=331697 RepID=A0A327QUJ4_9BACT|nr:TonB-dependent receptor [Chitinophaga skermanii]RAJ05407.1 iron complex outermembrane receptor protein [Chitinophaga skermanii]